MARWRMMSRKSSNRLRGSGPGGLIRRVRGKVKVGSQRIRVVSLRLARRMERRRRTVVKSKRRHSMI